VRKDTTFTRDAMGTQPTLKGYPIGYSSLARRYSYLSDTEVNSSLTSAVPINCAIWSTRTGIYLLHLHCPQRISRLSPPQLPQKHLAIRLSLPPFAHLLLPLPLRIFTFKNTNLPHAFSPYAQPTHVSCILSCTSCFLPNLPQVPGAPCKYGKSNAGVAVCCYKSVFIVASIECA
jgi:hypothetical protein